MRGLLQYIRNLKIKNLCISAMGRDVWKIILREAMTELFL